MPNDSGTCAYVTDAYEGNLCGAKADLFRYAVYVCDEHRMHIECEAQDIAAEALERLKSEWEAAEVDNLPDAEDRKFVYYIFCGDYVKIGMTNAPIGRLRQIQRGSVICPEGVDLTAAMLVGFERGGRALEKKRHAQFAKDRVVGEWFLRSRGLDWHARKLSPTRSLTPLDWKRYGPAA